MSAWIWVVIAIVAVVVIGIALWRLLAVRRTGRLQGQFGPEYERTLESSRSRRQAEADLESRKERRDRLDIRPLPRASRERYLEQSRAVQSRFVDQPELAVASAEGLIDAVMSDRGYPIDDFEQRAADISVDYPEVVEHYREGHRLARLDGDAGEQTEALRQAMRHYRMLFEQLVEDDADRPLGRDEGPGGAPTTGQTADEAGARRRA